MATTSSSVPRTPVWTTPRRELSELGAHVEAVHQDLRHRDEVDNLYKHVEATGRPLAAAALNAGVGQGGAFIENDLADELAIIDLNVSSTVQLAKLVLTDMATRAEGKVLITSSIAATMPGANQAVYNASKAFLQSFAVAVNEELSSSGVTITSLMPGPTETNFFVRAGMAATRIGRSENKDDPADVAKQGFEAMQSGQNRVVASSLVDQGARASERGVAGRGEGQAARLDRTLAPE